MSNEKYSDKRKEKEEAIDWSFPLQKIRNVEMEHEVKKSFIEYSMSVITARALPDVRDGMKPGQRRVLYSMYESHLTHDKPFCKSATTVGNVLGRYHPHGDSSVYGTMVHMAQDFSLRYPLIEGHGNFGSVDGDGAAAYRYTEARLDKIADEMMRDLDKEVVEMVPNFDNRFREPSVLPSRFPNLLVNGSMGIAVGMTTNVPPHNLGDVIDTTVYRMEHPDCSIEELIPIIKGPDFPTGAIIYGTNGIREAYLTGRGKISMRSRARVEEDEHRIVVTEIPFGVNKSMLCEAIAGLAKDKRIDGLTDLRDESGRDGMRIVIEYKHDANGQVILNQLFKYSQLQDTFSVYAVALVNGEPKTLNLAQILDYYIAHQKSVIVNRTRFDLNKALARAHILEGYRIAQENIDEVVRIMKTSPSIPESKTTLMDRFGLSDPQAQAIVEMTLGRLTGLEVQKIVDELARLEAQIAELRGILSDPAKVIEIIKNEMLEIKEKYGDDRRTEIVESTDDIALEDLIERHNCVITMSYAGYIKRQPADTYTAQHRGGKGIIGSGTKEEDYITKIMAVHSHSTLMMFTNTGRVYALRAFQIPEAGRTAKGAFAANIMQLTPEEKITSFISVNDFDPDAYLLMVTKFGVVKKTLLSEYEYQRKGGKIALTLDDGDELVFVMVTHGDNQLMIATHEGSAVRFSEEQVRAMGRTARGVRGINVEKGDYVVGVAVVETGKQLVTITENGFGKRSDYDEFRVMKSRGGKGVTAHNITEKTGKLCSIMSVDTNDDLMMMTDSGVMIRTPVADIPVYSRSAGGVIVMRMGEGQKLINCTKIAREEEAEAELEALPEETDAGDAFEKAPIEPVEIADGPDGGDETDENNETL